MTLLLFVVRGPLRRASRALLLAALVWPLAAGAAGDPFETGRLAPPDRNAPLPGVVADPCLDDAALPQALTLVDAIGLALCRNPRTRETWANARIAAAQLGVARSAQLPTLDGDLSAQRVETRNAGSGGQTQLSAGATLNYVLFDFGAREASLESARQSLIAANWTHNATLQQVLFDTVDAYYRLFAARENTVATHAAEESARESFEAAQARLSAGRGTRADVLQAQTAYSQAKLNRTRAEGDAAAARGTLASTLGFDADRALSLAPPPELAALAPAREAVDRLIETARSRRPDLLAAQAQVRAAESNARAAEAQGKPTISTFAGVSASQNSSASDPRSGAIGLTVSIPLFTGYRSTYQVRTAREQVQSQMASRERLASEIALDVWTSYQALQTEGQAYETALDLVASAQESYRAALARYKAGVGTLIDVLNAQSSAASADSQKIQSQFNWYISKASLVRALGTLDANLFADIPRSPAGGSR
jgi:TolC family type I secretion outer membrane protein